MDDNSNGQRRRFTTDRRGVLKGLAVSGAVSAFGLGGSQPVAADHRGFLTPAKLQKHIETRQRVQQSVEGQLVDSVSTGPFETSTASGQSGDEQVRILGDRNDDEQYELRLTAEESTDQTVRPWVYVKGFDAVGDKYLHRDVHDQIDRALDEMLAGDNFAEAAFPDATRPLISPASAVSTTTEGTDAWLPQLPPAPNHDSGRTYLEMVECYMTALYRDVPFSRYARIDPRGGSNERNDVAAAVQADYDYLASQYDEPGDPWFEGFGEYLLRDPVPGCDVGPYVSQLWYHDIPIGGMAARPKIAPIVGSGEPDLDGPPFGTTQDAWRQMVFYSDGAEPGHDATPDVQRGQRAWPSTGRDLASQVRDDPAYQPYLLAGLQLLGWGTPLTPTSYHDEERVNPYIDFGAVALLDVLARVCRNALIAAWNQKWYVHRRLRPETYAARVEDVRRGAIGLDIDDGFVEGNTVQAVVDEFGSAFLPQVYPEGAPAHPAYPSGHSVIAGACATVLKAFFEDIEIAPLLPAQGGIDAGRVKHAPTAAGRRLRAYDGDEPLTVHGEINKLASNIGMARIFAGVHYRSDHLYGMLLGEQVATATMWSHFTRNAETLGEIDVSSDVSLQHVRANYTDLVGRGGHPYSGTNGRLTEKTFEVVRQKTMAEPL